MQTYQKGCQHDGFPSKMFKEHAKRQNNVHLFVFEKVIQGNQKTLRSHSSWKVDQTLKYFAFVHYFQQKIEGIKGMELWGFCQALSKFIGTRNANQCRIHHKKMVKKFTNPKKMMKNIYQQIPDFKEMVSVYQKKLSLVFAIISNHNQQQQIRNNHENQHLQVKVQEHQLLYQDFFVQAQKQQKKLHEKQTDRQKFDAMKTDVTVKQQELDQKPEKPQPKKTFFDENNFLFNQNPVAAQMPISHPIWPPFFHPNSSFQKPILKKEEWQQCQHLYQKWAQKFKELMK